MSSSPRSRVPSSSASSSASSSSSPSTPDTFVARNPTDLVACVPVVLGFHPRDSVVLLTFGPPGASFHARVDLPVLPEEQDDLADVLMSAVRANAAVLAAVVLYTDDVETARSQGDVLLRRLLGDGVEVVEVLRVHDGHWHSLPEDGGPGTAYDLQTHPFTAQHVFAGHRVHRDRDELARTLVAGGDGPDGAAGPDGPVDRDAVAAAVERHRRRLQPLAAAGATALADEARWLQRRVRRRVRDGQRLDPDDAGHLLALAAEVPTRDVAWAEIGRPGAVDHVELWRELVRRAPRQVLPGAACLLAFAAWQHGDGALAWCALDRCLDVDPDYSMAGCIADVLTAAVPPGAWEPIAEAELPAFALAAVRGRAPVRPS